MNDLERAMGEGEQSDANDLASFDALVESLGRWAVSLPDWPPARRVRGEWEQIVHRLDRSRRELSRMLVVGVIGGTGTGKSTLVNALARCEVTAAGDEARPTTVNPVVVAARDVDLAWLPIEAMQARVVRAESPAIANIVLIDCPDPDTQAGESESTSRRRPPHDAVVRPSDSNRNRDLLEAVLPSCDVLLLVATAQKYRSWTVARELAAFAPGRPMLFVQTHASRDPDIREDWRRELESEGFVVPRIFRLDAVEAASRGAAALEPEPGFRELERAIDAELVGRAARRVRRTGAVDLVGWFLRQSQAEVVHVREPVTRLAAGVTHEQQRLERLLAAAVGERLRSSRSAWRRILADEVVEEWHGGPFAAFLQAVATVTSLWPRIRASGGGVVGRLLSGEPARAATGPGAWQAVEELGLSAGEVEQSRSILSGLAARARLGEPMVGRARLEEAQAVATATTLVERTGAWLTTAIDRLLADRRTRPGGPLVRIACEVLFSGLLVAVLVRAGWNFFVGHLWQGRPVDGGGFLLESFVWLILWGLLLRWGVLARSRAGLDRDIAKLASRLEESRLVDPLVADFADAAAKAGLYLDEGDRLARDHQALAARLGTAGGGLGRLQGKS